MLAHRWPTWIALAVVAATVDPTTAAWVVAAGWGAHAVWDFAHHRADAMVPVATPNGAASSTSSSP